MSHDAITRLHVGGKELILIGTAHVSKKSAELVKETIELEQPESVCIELDAKRFETMQNPKAWEETDIVQVIKQKRVGFMLANLALSAYQKRIAKKLGVDVGAEMLQGIQSAKDCGAELVLADRDIQTTFLRIWRSMNLWEKCKLFSGMLFNFGEDDDVNEADLETLMQADVLESALMEMRKTFPKVGQILITERDQYLAQKIRSAPGDKVIAVLGAAHVPGILQELEREEERDLEEISSVPPAGKTLKVLAWVIPLAVLGLLVYAFTNGLEDGLDSLGAWVLWNGGLSALGTLLVLGHPLSILTSFVVAPISSLNPLLAVGWFSGLVQAMVQKPKVEDLHNVQTDIFSLRGLLRNKVLKVLLVVVFANIGSSVGTFVAGADIIQRLF